ncbi:RNA polymerase sigma factor SigA [Aquisphaera giovannonii]|uniref:RNA polymerase sigma factor SigA n=1 Tax=Aquisphaera giovannonii TaxID=406548 RepID=A0A5B9VXQ8_9BACT|nr:sigma-70 family RNA polymerase sigma factor [Aquisphaera giovannonii]QEH32909.1 RNA polymerase sigma factor SigA [Aquisphaera giovannonii]
MYRLGTKTVVDPGRIYGRDMRRHELLSAEEERRLAQAARRGDRAARARLIQANIRLVAKIAGEFRGRGMDYDDLVCEGNVGLTRAADRFDSDRGCRFATYAKHWITEAIRAALRNTATTIRLPVHIYGLLAKCRRVERSLFRDRGRMPGLDEVATHLGLSETQVGMVEAARRARRIKLESGLGDDGGPWSPEEAVDGTGAPESDLERADEREEVLRRMGLLNDRERMVVTLRFGLEGHAPQTLAEIGRRM